MQKKQWSKEILWDRIENSWSQTEWIYLLTQQIAGENLLSASYYG